MDALFLIAIGVFIGWNFPQPAYAKWLQDKLVTWIKSLGSQTPPPSPPEEK